MASDDCAATFSALESAPILHFWGNEIVTPAKRFSVSSFLLKYSKTDILEFLQATFADKRQLILCPSSNGNHSSLASYGFEELDKIVHFKPLVESASIIHDGNSQAYDTLRSNFLAANASWI